MSLREQFLRCPDIILQQSRDGIVPEIRLIDVLPFIEGKAGKKAILEQFPTLWPKKILKAKGLYDAKVAPPETKPGLRILCDENVSHIHVRVCQRFFGYATSIPFEGLASHHDQGVWDFAVAGGFDYILTHDKRNVGANKDALPENRDLTYVALEAWKGAWRLGDRPDLPQIIHLNSNASATKYFGHVARHSMRDVFNSRAEREAPILRLNESGLAQMVTIEDLFLPNREERETRETIMARKLLRKMLPDRNAWSDRETPEVRRAKRRVTRNMAILHAQKKEADARSQDVRTRLAVRRMAPV